MWYPCLLRLIPASFLHTIGHLTTPPPCYTSPFPCLFQGDLGEVLIRCNNVLYVRKAEEE